MFRIAKRKILDFLSSFNRIVKRKKRKIEKEEKGKKRKKKLYAVEKFDSSIRPINELSSKLGNFEK